jgi:hypothetical protein
MILMMHGHHSFIYPFRINILNIVNGVLCVVFVKCLKTYGLLSVRTQLPLFRNSFLFLYLMEENVCTRFVHSDLMMCLKGLKHAEENL